MFNAVAVASGTTSAPVVDGAERGSAINTTAAIPAGEPAATASPSHLVSTHIPVQMPLPTLGTHTSASSIAHAEVAAVSFQPTSTAPTASMAVVSAALTPAAATLTRPPTAHTPNAPSTVNSCDLTSGSVPGVNRLKRAANVSPNAAGGLAILANTTDKRQKTANLTITVPAVRASASSTARPHQPVQVIFQTPTDSAHCIAVSQPMQTNQHNY
jgi:hypothetical protein